MDFNFLFTYYTCFDKIEGFIGQKNVDTNTIPVIELPYNNVAQAETILFQILSVKDLPVFSVMISSVDSSNVNKKWLSILVSLISHIAYNKLLDKKIIWLNGQAAVSGNELATKLKSLGFNNLSLIDVNNTASAQNENINFFHLRSITDEPLLFNAAKSAFFSLKTPFQIVLHNQGATSLHSIKEKLNDYIEQNYTPAEIQLLQKIFSLNEKVSDLQGKLLNKENLLTTRQVYLDFLLNQYTTDGDNLPRLNEELKIRKFYHYEYEILPMWYKQFGHIIKVLMGKRSFKSLFDDKVKKYKD